MVRVVVERKLEMKDIICKEYDEGTFLGYKGEILANSKVGFFLPVSFQLVDENNRIIAFFDVSDTDEMKMQYDGTDAPDIAMKLIEGMMEACDYYIMPEDYLIKREFIRVGKNNKLKLLYVPNPNPDRAGVPVGMWIRRVVAIRVRELYPKEGIAYRETLDSTIEILKDGTLGLETCIRKLENIRADAYTERMERSWSGIDFSMQIV